MHCLLLWHAEGQSHPPKNTRCLKGLFTHLNVHRSLLCKVETALGEAGREAAQAGDELDRFCRYCCTREAQLVTASSHFQSGQMLVEAIQGALPRDEAVKVLVCMPQMSAACRVQPPKGVTPVLSG